ncbi:hypothetical protein [Achromobacter marplatensis]|uniref:hypothetical protein n=1 Tax=Achromobacter marplatensis TaxID=470868 RepID=UPI0002780915|nr:hypothetical protein [Achromobacter marplatensis]EJO31261.1 hypothetical protein QWC_12578 [Achromobacter marplatensis]
MVDPIQQTAQINLPNPRTPLIRFQLPNGAEVLGYPTREFMALLRQFSIRVGGTGSDVDIITPDSDILAPLGVDAGVSGFLGAEQLMLISGVDLQAIVAAAVAQEVQMAVAQLGVSPGISDQSIEPREAAASPLANEMTMGISA